MEIVKRGMLNVAPVVVAAQQNCKYQARTLGAGCNCRPGTRARGGRGGAGEMVWSLVTTECIVTTVTRLPAGGRTKLASVGSLHCAGGGGDQ